MKKKAGYIKIDRELTRTLAWQALSMGAGWLLIDIWSKHNGFNNGEITYSVREAQRRLGCGRTQAVRFLRELEDKGFIVATRRGSLSWKTGQNRGTAWRLTMEPHKGKPATREYLTWQPVGEAA